MKSEMQDPVTLYRDIYRREFADAVLDYINDAVRKTGADIKGNAKLVKEIHKLEKKHASSQRRFWCWMIFLLLLVAVAAIWWLLWYVRVKVNGIPLAGGWIAPAVYSAAALILVCCVCTPAALKHHSATEQLENLLHLKIGEAKKTFAALFSCFDRHTALQLTDRVLPQVRFDRQLSGRRFADLVANFGMQYPSPDNQSVSNMLSGTLYGYPFLFRESRVLEWQVKRYYGSKLITWTTRDGKQNIQFHTQTLTAWVEKPCPLFLTEKKFFFGHDAAPALTFSRKPSPLSGGEESVATSRKKKRVLKKLHVFQQNLTDESQYTMMSNQEFEVLYHAVDRNDEVQFRLLFSPLAQQNTLTLLNDKVSGYGDDFHFFKREKLITIIADHLNELDFSTEISDSDFYDFSLLKQWIYNRYTVFFRAVYFTLAPLLAIPLYGVSRSDPGREAANGASLWEMEKQANLYKRGVFTPSSCTTECLFSAHDLEADANCTSCRITAYGFRGKRRVERVSVWGDDGNLHSVPVEWIEYVPVKKTTRLKIENEPL